MIRAVTFATEKPLREELEALLARIADGDPYADLAPLLPKLAVRRYVNQVSHELTDFGWAYLNARRGGPRATSAVMIRSVDVAARTARVLAPAFSAEQLVTVPMDQVVNNRTGLTVDTASTVTLHAEINTDARQADDVILTKVRNPALAVTARPEVPGGDR
ncbi:hypothetical protein ACR6C2_08525 [Streptomyces sp. INA 01156]